MRREKSSAARLPSAGEKRPWSSAPARSSVPRGELDGVVLPHERGEALLLIPYAALHGDGVAHGAYRPGELRYLLGEALTVRVHAGELPAQLAEGRALLRAGEAALVGPAGGAGGREGLLRALESALRLVRRGAPARVIGGEGPDVLRGLRGIFPQQLRELRGRASRALESGAVYPVPPRGERGEYGRAYELEGAHDYGEQGEEQCKRGADARPERAGLRLAGAHEKLGPLRLAPGLLDGPGGVHALEGPAERGGARPRGGLGGGGIGPLRLAHPLAGALKALARGASLALLRGAQLLREGVGPRGAARELGAGPLAFRDGVRHAAQALLGGGYLALQLGYGPAPVVAARAHPGAQPLGGLAGGDLLLAGGHDPRLCAARARRSR